MREIIRDIQIIKDYNPLNLIKIDNWPRIRQERKLQQNMLSCTGGEDKPPQRLFSGNLHYHRAYRAPAGFPRDSEEAHTDPGQVGM